MSADDLRPAEVFATNPVIPNATPTDAEMAKGILGGAADRSFFNYVWKRFSEVILKNQVESKKQKTSVLTATGGVDPELLYYDTFIGTKGDDITQRTPIKGNVLNNDGGGGVDAFVLDDNNSVVRKKLSDIPVYTDVGENSSNLIFQLSIITDKKDYILTPTFPSAGLVINASGEKDGTYIQLKYGFLQISTLVGGTETIKASKNIDKYSDKSLVTLKVFEALAGDVTVEIPEMNVSYNFSDFVYTIGSYQTARPATTKHGLICHYEELAIQSLKITKKDIVA